MGCDMRATLVSNLWGTLTTVCLTRVMHTGFVLTSALSLHPGRFLRALGKLAAQFGVAVVITNQVRGVRVVPYTAPAIRYRLLFSKQGHKFFVCAARPSSLA